MEAFLYEKQKDGSVVCSLCRHRCHIKQGQRGICGVRENISGTLQTLVYDKLIAKNIDPIEKKPIYHLSPGSLSYSVATVGCNFKCRFCQNSDIAQMPSDRNGMIMGDPFKPESIVSEAIRKNCKSISYTYTEPTVYFELAYDTAVISKKQGLRNIFVTNGYMTPEALAMITPYLDAANVDLKAFSDDFYRTYCGAKRDGVLDTLKQMKSAGIMIEITTLVIPGLNDKKEEITSLARFIVNELGPETPWHVSRFHPTYHLLDYPSTPVGTLAMVRETGLKEGLYYVYTGNVPGDEGENTFCHACKNKIIERWGYRINNYYIENGCCRYCKTPIHGLDI
ncbi:MAG: AmmeMemoRadiSam system radical SAM enzyme [Proteobacteria bacterium]|nr:AmmeMemoRadiSam system radical SAM enzyme [Pseudomonadota bacterium]